MSCTYVRLLLVPRILAQVRRLCIFIVCSTYHTAIPETCLCLSIHLGRVERISTTLLVWEQISVDVPVFSHEEVSYCDVLLCHHLVKLKK